MKYIFLHGTPGDGSVWSEVMARRPAGAGCALLDLPDHGRADDEAQGSTAALEASSSTRPYLTPSVLLHAGRDAAVPLDRGRELCALGSHPRLEAWDSASHLLPLAHGPRIADVIFAA